MELVKELTEIQGKGCPPGIETIDVSTMDQWTFSVSVLGDETVYRVSAVPLCRFRSPSPGL